MENRMSDAALVFRALAHPCRLRLLVAISQEGVCDVTRLTHLGGLQQPYVSQQLRRLRSLGLVTREHTGQRVYYRLVSTLVEDLLSSAGLIDATPPVWAVTPAGDESR